MAGSGLPGTVLGSISPRVLTFPLRYWFTIGHQGYLGLEMVNPKIRIRVPAVLGYARYRLF